MNAEQKEARVEIASYALNKILIPLDGSGMSERILDLIRWVLGRKQAEVKLLTVVSADEGWTVEESPVESACDYLNGRREALLGYGARVRYAIRVGDASEQILADAEEYGPSLIAMATHGRRGIDRLRRGSVTERVLRGANTPVLAANPSGLEENSKPRLLNFGSILVPLDGSWRATEVLPAVSELARLHGSVVTLLHVEEPIIVPSIVPVSLGDLPRAGEVGRSMLEPWREALVAAGVTTMVRTITGFAPTEILRIANEEGFDLVALTTHGRTGLARLALGSIAEHVLRRCARPVLLKRTLPSTPDEPHVSIGRIAAGIEL